MSDPKPRQHTTGITPINFEAAYYSAKQQAERYATKCVELEAELYMTIEYVKTLKGETTSPYLPGLLPE